MRWSRVDLPLPEGPTRATRSPGNTAHDASASAGTAASPRG